MTGPDMERENLLVVHFLFLFVNNINTTAKQNLIKQMIWVMEKNNSWFATAQSF